MFKGIEQKQEKNRGITLIALIITIIVMLILVAVTITMAINGGLFDYAKKAVSETKNAMEQEQEMISEILGLEEKVDDETPGDITDGETQDGSFEKPYKIRSVEDYLNFIERTREDSSDYIYDAYVDLETNLDFKNSNSYNDPENTEIFGDYNYDGKTEGIMKELTNETERGLKNGLVFAGTFNGNGYTISNIYMKDTLTYYSSNDDKTNNDGVIALIQENRGVIKNLNIQGKIDVYIDERTSLAYIGGIAGQNEHGGQILNCTTNMQITVTGDVLTMPEGTQVYIGGISATNEDKTEGTKIDGCINNGSINCNLEFCSNTNSGAYHLVRLGGITADNDSDITNCINKGSIGAYKKFTTTVDTYDTDIYIGGIAGKNNDTGIIENCINCGAVTATSETSGVKIGGITGDTDDLDTCIVKNVYNSGKIKATSADRVRLGGIVGDANGVIDSGYNRGIIEFIATGTKTPYVGSILGDYHSSNVNTTITNCFYNKVEGLYGGEGEDRTGITPVDNLTQEQIIEYMNTNVETNNMSSSRIWYSVIENNGILKFNVPNI